MKANTTLFLLICAMLLSVSDVVAQWYEGTVMLNNRESLVGTMSFHGAEDLVRVKEGEKIKVYTAYQVNAVEYYDAALDVARRIESKQVIEENGRTYRRFFEVVLEGGINVVRRPTQHIGPQRKVDTYRSREDILLEQVNGYEYYTYIAGHLQKIKHFRAQLLPLLLQEHRSEMEKFLKENQIDTNLLSHNLMVINYFNQLEE